MTNMIGSTRREFLGKVVAGAAAATAVPLYADDPAPKRSRYFKDRGWLVGCWTRPWAQEHYGVAFDMIAEAGFKYVTLTGAKTDTGRVIAPDTSLKEATRVGTEARKRGLEITHVYGGGLPLHRGTDSLRRMIDNTAAAGGWSVMILGLGNEETYDLYIKAIADCCEEAARQDVALVLKPHGGLTATGPHCRRAIEQVGHPNLTLMYDPGNILFYSDGQVDPLEDCTTVDGLVTSLSVKDYRHPRNVAVTPGTGQIDFPALIARLRKGGFTHGAALVEIVSPGDRSHTLAEVKKARRFIEELLGVPG